MDKNISTNDANHIDFQSEKKDLNQEESKEEENKDLSQEESKEEENRDTNQKESKEEENKDLNQKESKEEENKDLSQEESKEEESIDLSDAEIEKIFNFLYQLIIQNIQNLIINYQTELFQFFFCPNSDIVTIITSFYYFSKNSKKMQIESGFSIEFVNNIYKKLEKMYETDNGCELIISAYEKFHNQKKDLLELIDSFIQNDISKNNLQLNECQATFFKVIDARMKKIPTLIYKMKTEDGLEKNIEISRPGFCKLESPRNIIVLAKYHDNKENIEHGVLLHRNINFDNNDYGIASHEFKHENYNFYFFNYLFQSYWSDRIIKDDFIEIYNTSLEDKNTSSIVHFTKSKFGSYLNYCPRNKLVQDLIQKRIKACLLLLVVFPNSIIFKHENPLCAIEFLGNNSNNYNTKIHIIDEERSDCPVAYPLNNMTLDFALTYYYKFKKTNQLRFSITGENFYYKEYQGREIESIFTNPNINSNNKSVFDSNCPSHIVLLIDNNFPHRPENIEPLSWIPKNEKELTENIHNKEMFDSNENQKILDISSQIISDFGKVEKQSDIFFITLSNSFPVVSKGSIPDYIRGLVGFDQSNGNIVKGGMHKLIKHFTKGLIKKQILSESIPLETISSTDHWKNYPKNEENILTILNKISVAIKNHFQIDDKNINIEFIGYSLILLHIKGLSESSVCHKIIDDIWNDEYIKCIADDEIKSILNDIQDIDLQVTNVFHERLNNIKVYNKKCLNLHKDEFIKRVNKVANMFGFLKLTISDYIENKEHNDISGYINVELMNSRTSITFASMINEEFRNEKESNSKIDTIRQIYAMNNNNNNEINIMIIPSTNDSLEHEILQHSIDSNCIGVCNEEKKYLPQYLYQYNFFCVKHAICKDCIFETFESMTDLQNSLNTQTYMIDREKMRKVYDLLPNFLFYKIEFYEFVPFAQNIWTLITENDLISHYVKLWFTLNMDILIRISPLYFVHCPHTIRRTPKDENVFICSKCNLIYHPKCQSYHFINEECTILKENEKRCPYCFAIAEKISGCNHVICESCKKHWCFKCEHSPIFDTASQCYDHMKIEHNESYIFSHEATHIYLNPQNENEIVKLERKKLYSWKCIPFDNELIIHDHQNGTELQICSYDEQNLFLNSLYDLPIITESIYDYDIVDFEDDVKYDFDDYRKRKYCKYFNYTISTNFIESDK